VLRDACTSSRAEVKDFFMDHVFPLFTRVLTVDEALALVER
jgi:hypothetical protein